MHMKLIVMTVAALVAAPELADAKPVTIHLDGVDLQCHRLDEVKPPAKKKKTRRKKMKHKPVVTTPAPTCQAGPQGPKGDDGKNGRDGITTTIHEYHDARFPLAVGIFGTYLAPYGDWAWGPALRVDGTLTDKYDASLMVGFALGAAGSEHETGYQVRLGASRRTTETFTLEAGLSALSLDGDGVGANYLLADASVIVTRTFGPFKTRLSLSPLVVGGYRLEGTSDTELTTGFSGSLTAGGNW